MTSTPPDPRAIIEELERQLHGVSEERDTLAARVATLEDRLGRQERVNAATEAALGKGGRIAGRIALSLAMGFGVRRAFERVFQAMKGGERFPVPELADLGASVVRRLAFAQLLGAFISVLPLLLLIQQNWLLSGANQRQDTQARVARATQLIELMYETVPGCTAAFGSDKCAPEASARLRSEAARAYVEIERSERTDTIDLSHARLDQVDLSGAALREVDFTDANFGEADLSLANLRDAILDHATLTDAVLDGADLRGAGLESADLSRSSLVGARLDKARLAGANLELTTLSGADLRKVEGLDQARLGKARYDAETRFPSGFSPDKHGMVEVGK